MWPVSTLLQRCRACGWLWRAHDVSSTAANMCCPPPLTHTQLLYNLLDLGMDPQAALDAPRFCVDRMDSSGAATCTKIRARMSWRGVLQESAHHRRCFAVGPTSVLDSHVLLEAGMDEAVAAEFASRGHTVEWKHGVGRALFGKGAIIMRDACSGVLVGGADPRGDGAVAAW